MKPIVDLSIGQRMMIGFGLLLAIWAVLLAVVFTRQAESGRAQDAFVERIAPLAEAASTLEQSVLYVGIGVRTYLLSATPERLTAAERALERVRTALHHAGELPKDPEAAEHFRSFSPLVEDYLDRASSIVHRRAIAGLTPAIEQELSFAREKALAGVRKFGALQEQNARKALAGIAAARRNVDRAILASTAAALIAFVGLAYVTTRSIRRPTRELVAVASALQAGDWKPALAAADEWHGQARAGRVRDEMRQLRAAFGAAALSLDAREQRLRAEGQVASAGASSLAKDRVAEAALSMLSDHVKGVVGVLYWREEDTDVLRPIARQALGPEVAPVRVGEGLPGRAAHERRVIVLRDIPADSPFVVKLGYNETPPKTAVAVPVLFGNEVEGVVLLATLADFDDHAIAFLSTAATQLGIALHNARSHERLQALLADLRASHERIETQNEQLQAQNDEIQAQQEELQVQNEELQAQNEHLRNQQEQIRTQNEELTSQAEQLRLHSGLLAQADHRKNEFLGVLAHELRNPLAPITTSLYLLARAEPGSAQAERAQAVLQRQVQHLTRLIDDLLDVTRIARGKVRLETARLDLVEVVRACMEDQQAALDERGLGLVADLPDHPVWVDGDRTRLSQVAGNLLSNAVKFTPEGQRICVRLRADYGDGQAVLQVVDTGIGIEPALLPLLFQPFRQGTSGLARANGGLGLGLALVKSLVELHGGSVEARSEGPGHGAEFLVRLPLADTPRESRPASVPDRAWRLLVVEDNVDAANSLREALELLGHSVEVAYSAREALNLAPVLGPEAIICDIGLPGMNGFELAEQLRRDSRLSHVPLIALTGYAAQADKMQTARAGFDEHLAKPVSVPQLVEVLSRFEHSRRPPGAETQAGIENPPASPSA